MGTRHEEKKFYRLPVLFLRKVSSSLYFLPASITLLSVAVALVASGFEQTHSLSGWFPDFWWSDQDSAREFLSTSAGVMITITGVAFSVVVVALTLASNQFCPRVLTRYVENRVNRLVFGVLTGNFAFALTLLATQQKNPENLPGLSLTLCFLFDLASTIVFIYFIHHTATSLQVDNLVADIRQATLRNIAKLKSEEADPVLLGPANSATDLIPMLGCESRFTAAQNGYVEAVRLEDLISISARVGEPIEVLTGLGDWVTPETACIKPLKNEVDDELIESIQACFEVGDSRRLDLDISYGFREIVDIALKAVSPAVNDPTTAVMCLNNLGTMMEALCRGGWPPVALFGSDEEGRGSVRFYGNGPEDYLRLVTEQLTIHVVNAPRLAVALMHWLCRLALQLDDESWRQALRERAEAILLTSREGRFEPRWYQLLTEYREQLERLIDTGCAMMQRE